MKTRHDPAQNYQGPNSGMLSTSASRRLDRVRNSLFGFRAGTLALCWLVVVLAAAHAFPPAPHHTFFGTVRNEWGTPLDVTGAEVFIESTNAVSVSAQVAASTEPGVNYRLQVPMDSGTTADLYQPTALCQSQPFQLMVRIRARTYLPLEMTTSARRLGLPADTTRLDLTLGEDADGDGLPDAWERALIDALGGGLTLSDIRPEDDLDGDGVSNLDEYLAGSFAFDPNDGFRLRITSVSPQAFGLEFLAVPGRTYTVWSSTDLSEWNPASFRIAADGPGSPLRDSFSATDVRLLQVEVPPAAGWTTNRFFKAMVH